MTDSFFFTVIVHNALLLLAIINPIGNVPLYVDLTKDMSRKERLGAFNLAWLTALILVVTFAMVGDWALRNLFDVTLDQFKIAGGIMLFIVATRGWMIDSRKSWGQLTDRSTLAVFPIAFPIIVGPGTLAMTIILAQDNGRLVMLIITLVTFLVVYVVLTTSYLLMRLIGRYAALIIPRLLYIFLAAKAVAMVLEGLQTILGVGSPKP